MFVVWVTFKVGPRTVFVLWMLFNFVSCASYASELFVMKSVVGVPGHVQSLGRALGLSIVMVKGKFVIFWM